MKRECRETGKVEETERRTMDNFSGVEGDGKRRRIRRDTEEELQKGVCVWGGGEATREVEGRRKKRS